MSGTMAIVQWNPCLKSIAANTLHVIDCPEKRISLRMANNGNAEYRGYNQCLPNESPAGGIIMKLLSRSAKLHSICIFVLLFLCAAVAQTARIPQSDIDLIDSLYFKADVDSAIVIAREFSTKYPDDPRPFHELGRLIIKAGNRDLFPEAEASLSRCLALQPDEAWMIAWSYLSLAYIYFETQRDSLAVAYCNRAIELNATRNCTAAAKKLLHRHSSGDTQVAFSVTRRTQHFAFHYPDSAMIVKKAVSRTEQEYEKAYERLLDFWGCEPPTPIKVFIYHSEEEIKSAVGQAAHLAYPEKCEIHTTIGATSGHELTHIFSYYFNSTQRNALLVEGIAGVLNQAHSRLACDWNAALKLKQSPEVPLAAVNADWKQFDPDYASSFVYLLVEEYGPDKFLTLYRMKGSLEANVPKVYGVSSGDIEQSWRKRIETLIGLLPEMDSLLTAGRREDYGAVIEQIDQISARYGKTAELIQGKGQSLMSLGRYKEAIETLGELFATKSYAIEPPYIFQWGHYNMGKSYAELGEKEKAMYHLKEAIKIDQAHDATEAADSLLSSLTN